ncbi:hypothetical protein GEMRC1_001631 [Eukaryota sp. GEM-RC1]
MECPVCCSSFDTRSLLPLIVCEEGHTLCSNCSSSVKKCPFCRNPCLKDRRVNHTLKAVLDAAGTGDLCPQIPGDQIVVKDCIGQGGFADVHAGEWFGLPIALKKVSLTDLGRLTLQRELSLLIKLNHPSILRVYGLSCFGESDIGIVMEKAATSLPCPNALSHKTLRYAQELCRAICFLHYNSIVHADLKPENVLLVNDHVRVADFGTSRNLAATTKFTRDNAITLKYAAPEQFENTVTPMSDIYSLGVVLYELLTHKEAFQGQCAAALYGAKMGKAVLPFDRTTPTALKKVICKCMSFDPTKRPKLTDIIKVLDDLGANLPANVVHVDPADEVISLRRKLRIANITIDRERESFNQERERLLKKVSQLEKNTSITPNNSSSAIVPSNSVVESSKRKSISESQLQGELQRVNLINTNLASRVSFLENHIYQMYLRVPKNGTVEFSVTQRHPELTVNVTKNNVKVSGKSETYRNILGSKPLLPDSVYQWKVRYRGNPRGFRVGVIDEKKFTVDGKCFDLAHCVSSSNMSYGCLSDLSAEWKPGQVLEVTADMVLHILTVKSVADSTINVTGTLPTLGSGSYYPYFYLWRPEQELFLV